MKKIFLAIIITVFSVFLIQTSDDETGQEYRNDTLESFKKINKTLFNVIGCYDDLIKTLIPFLALHKEKHDLELKLQVVEEKLSALYPLIPPTDHINSIMEDIKKVYNQTTIMDDSVIDVNSIIPYGTQNQDVRETLSNLMFAKKPDNKTQEITFFPINQHQNKLSKKRSGVGSSSTKKKHTQQEKRIKHRKVILAKKQLISEKQSSLERQSSLDGKLKKTEENKNSDKLPKKNRKDIKSTSCPENLLQPEFESVHSTGNKSLKQFTIPDDFGKK